MSEGTNEDDFESNEHLPLYYTYLSQSKASLYSKLKLSAINSEIVSFSN
jgi:hypothetical protein